jgi:cation-transporting ATPase F
METILCKHWHHCSADDLATLLETDPDRGLAAFEVRHRQARFGPNALTVRKRKSPIKQFLLQFHQPLIYILLSAGIITAFLREWVDSGVILGVVLVNAVVGFIQESRAEKAMESLKSLMRTGATVLRDSEKQIVPSEELVPGDIVFLQSGDKVPADLRLFLVRELQIDESALTGESVPVAKVRETLDPDTILADRRNMAYAGTLVTFGQGQGIVVATGDRTETGRISELISEAAELSTPLTKKIARFSRVLLYVILGLAGLTYLVGVVRGESAFAMFMAAVALAVGAIPEGLPAAVTITLAIGVKRMARARAIIRRLPAVETLGSTTVICSDKTGTLTENQMTVQRIFAGEEDYLVTGTGYAPDGQFLREGAAAADRTNALAECLTAGLLCNDSRMVESDGRWTVQGDPTEGALLVAARKAGLAENELKAALPRLDVIPFESERQYMVTLHERDSGSILYVKGAVERVLDHCSDAIGREGDGRPLDRETVLSKAEEMARDGLRVLAFARRQLPPDHRKVSTDDPVGLTFLGLQGMIDPPRAEAVRAVEACRSAGIAVKMITGDHALTAAAIAEQLGLIDRDRTKGAGVAAMTGRELAGLTDTGLIEAAERTPVFARVAPEQKLRLVEALQARGHVVAMTGDGVNDAPALKQADIGVAMGITGTDVAKEAADMVLTDDNFATIEGAVEEGRRVFDNLTKFIVWTLPTNGGEGLVIMAAIMAGVMLPILPVQILWINMTTAILLGLMLAFEPQEADIMMRPPRDPGSPILTGVLIGRIALVSVLMLGSVFALFLWMKGNGENLTEARTVAVNLFVMIELFYLFNCRSLTRSMFSIGIFSNLWVLGGSAAMIALQMLFTYAPFMNRMFHSAPIGLRDWTAIVLISAAVYLIVGAEKWVRNRVRPGARA